MLSLLVLLTFFRRTSPFKASHFIPSLDVTCVEQAKWPRDQVVPRRMSWLVSVNLYSQKLSPDFFLLRQRHSDLRGYVTGLETRSFESWSQKPKVENGSFLKVFRLFGITLPSKLFGSSWGHQIVAKNFATPQRSQSSHWSWSFQKNFQDVGCYTISNFQSAFLN